MVLIILPSLRSGGTEWQVLSLIREMVSRVNVVLWVYDSKNNESDLRSEFEKIEGLSFVYGKSLKSLLKARLFGPKVIVSYAINYYIPEIILVLITRAFLVTERRNLYQWIKDQKPKKLQEFIRNRLTNAVVCNSESVKNVAQEMEWGITRKIQVIHNSVDLPELDMFLGVRPNICSVGNIKAGKGVEDVVRCYGELKKQSNGLASFSIYGRLDDRSILRNIPMQLFEEVYKGVGAKCSMYRFGDVLVHLSESEGFPNSVLEAMASGMSLVLSDIAVHRELFGKHAFFVSGPSEGAEVLSKLIVLRRDNRAEYLSICERNRAFAEKFSIRTKADQYMCFLNRG